MNSPQKHAFIVLGFARSGTSVITRGLKALGVDLGDRLTPPHSTWNMTGFFEDNDIVHNINKQAFKTLNFAPYGIKVLDKAEQTSPLLNDVKNNAIELVKQRFSSTDWWGFKDPSTVKLLAFWQALFAELNINDHYVIALRNPLASAQSYTNLTGLELEVGLLLWLMHLVPAINGTHGKKRIMVSYDLLLHHPREQLQRMKSLLAIPDLAAATEIDLYVENFINKNLHHYEYSHTDLLSHPSMAIAPLCAKVYNIFMQLAQDALTFTDSAFILAWHEIQNELDKIYPIYCYIDEILKKNNSLNHTINAIYKSTLWKMLHPFMVSRMKKQKVRKRLIKAYE